MKIWLVGSQDAVMKSREERGNGIWNIYMICMIALLVLRYILKRPVPPILFLGVAMLPVLFGTETHQLAFIMSCIPFSIAFQYKYALLILCVVWIWISRGQLWSAQTLLLVALMMVWEFFHVFFGHFSYVEYIRGFAELLTLGMVMTRKLQCTDVKLIIRALAVSVVAVDCIILFMQLQQNGFSIVAVLSRSASSYRFGHANMDVGRYALNFNPNNLGFINNLSLCSLLILYWRSQMKWYDVVLAVFSALFAMMTLSRTTIICLILIMVYSMIPWERIGRKEIARTVIMALIIVIVVNIILRNAPALVENLRSRFGRSDITGGRIDLIFEYLQHSFSSPIYLFFGIGMQGIAEKMNSIHGIRIAVPHNGLQEVMVAWGLIGLLFFLAMLGQVLLQSRYHAKGRVIRVQYLPFMLVLVNTMAGQFLTSGRALLALVLAYIVLSVGTEEYLINTGDRD